MATKKEIETDRQQRIGELRAMKREITGEFSRQLADVTAELAALSGREAAAAQDAETRRREAIRFGPYSEQIREARKRRHLLAAALEATQERIRDFELIVAIDLDEVREHRRGKISREQRDAKRQLPELEKTRNHQRALLESAEAELKDLEERAVREWK